MPIPVDKVWSAACLIGVSRKQVFNWMDARVASARNRL